MEIALKTWIYNVFKTLIKNPQFLFGRLFLENSKLECSENENNVLGQGGSGTVIYRARYQGKPVAVKRFQIKKCKGSPTSAAGTVHRFGIRNLGIWNQGSQAKTKESAKCWQHLIKHIMEIDSKT